MKTIPLSKKTIRFSLLSLFIMSLFMINPAILCAQVKVVDDHRVGIGTDTPDPSAKLEIHSTNNPNNPNSFKGFLKPRMTYVQMLSIQNPANGLEVYVTDADKRKTYWWDDQLQQWVTHVEGGNPSDELQTLSTNNQPGNISISDGNTITINVNDTDADPFNELQNIYTNGQPGDISITDGSNITINIDDADADPNNEFQVLSLNGNDLTISNGNTVTLSGGTVGGNGTKNFIPKWTPDGTYLGDSQIYDDGNTVSIGTLQEVDASENIGLLLKGRLAFEFPDNTNFMESNIVLGYKSGNINQTGLNNVFIGNLAGNGNTTGTNNNFFGLQAGSGDAIHSNTGSQNNFFGREAGKLNTSGYNNNFLGRATGKNNKEGHNNNFIGYQTGMDNNSGYFNNFFGPNAGRQNTTGYSNNFFGNAAGLNILSGAHNNFFGQYAGRNSLSGGGNNFFGYQAGGGHINNNNSANGSGSYNNFFGFRAGKLNTSGVKNNFFGPNAGHNNATGSHNNFFGPNAGSGQENHDDLSTINYTNTGSLNNFFGAEAGRYNSTGSFNNFFGYQAGSGAVNYNNTGIDYTNQGSNNNFFGSGTGRLNTTGSNNNFLGKSAGYNNTTGKNNIYIGSNSGYNNESGYNNIFIGNHAGYNETGSNGLYISNSGTNTPLVYGEFDNKIININGALTSTDFNTFEVNGRSLHADIKPPYGGYAFKLNTNISGGWAQEVSWLLGNSKFASLGLSGTNNTVTAMYFSANMNGAPYGSHSSVNQNTAMYLRPSGNLGLGTLFPTHKLDANGSIRVRGGIADVNDNTGAENQVITSDGNGGWSWQDINNIVPDGESDHNASLQRVSQNKFKTTLSHGGGDIDMHWAQSSSDARIFTNDNVGIRKDAENNTLEINGNASKSTTGDWLANSDARLKKNITPLSPEETLEQLLRLQGITYQWNDNKTSYDRPNGIQYGFTAQNIREVFPTLVSEDNQGYLQTAYGTYDAMYVEAIRALVQQNENLRTERKKDHERISNLEISRKKDRERIKKLENEKTKTAQMVSNLETRLRQIEMTIPQTSE